MSGTPNKVWFVFVFLVFLVVVQLAALRSQFTHGFVPFLNDPIRVPFSWDMFTNRVERCSVDWDPPLQTRSGPLASLRNVGTVLEWDLVFDLASTYGQVANWICRVGGKTLQIKIHCFYPNGTQTHDEIKCG